MKGKEKREKGKEEEIPKLSFSLLSNTETTRCIVI